MLFVCEHLFRGLRRCIRPISTASESKPDHTRELLRQLLRETAQTVAVVTTVVHAPSSAPSASPQLPTSHDSSSAAPQAVYHGATLSSFTSIALDPHPLVAFSLRTPSRMANALNAHAHPPPDIRAHMVINLLSAAQPHLAVTFSRPDLHPHPFARSQWTHSAEGIPVFAGVLGALSCMLLRSIPLRDLGCDYLAREDLLDRPADVQKAEGDICFSSELFIAQVLRIEHVPEVQCDDTSLRTLPLLYHRRQYDTVSNVPPRSPP